MKSKYLNERQLKTMYQIMDLTYKISPDHWFTNHVLHESGSGTLGALEKKGYLISKEFVENHTHWQYTGKEIEDEIGCIKKIIESYQKTYTKHENQPYTYEWTLRMCKERIDQWKSKEHELECYLKMGV